MNEQKAYEELKAKLSERHWRINNLYKIKDKQGNIVTFVMNPEQERLYRSMHYFNIVLKARQLGFTTFTLIFFLDACLFNANHSAGVIAHTTKDAEDLFTNKVKFAYDNLPDWLKKERIATQDSSKKLTFNNGSSFTIGTSLRSGTYQKLLISEYGKVSAKYPEKAKEIKTGALNSVDAGQIIFVESTAEGKAGEFFELCAHARRLSQTNRELSPLEPKFHFFPWYENKLYTLNDNIPMDSKLRNYLDSLPITEGQKNWYAAKYAIMKFEMKREYPSTPDEAFEGSTEGSYYREEMASMRATGRIRPVPLDTSHGVYTFWDLGGISDQMSIIFAQVINSLPRVIDYHESNENGWEFYANLLKDKGYTYIRHFWPHDGGTRIQGKQITSSKQIATELGINPLVIIPRTASVDDDIRVCCKPTLQMVSMDNSKCSVLINHLDNYRRKWDASTSQFLREAEHNEASHAADSFRTMAVAFKSGLLYTGQIHIANKSSGLQSRKILNRSKGLHTRYR